MNLILIRQFDKEYQDFDVVGVASNMAKAIKMLDDYHGGKYIILKKRDVRDSGIEQIWDISSEDMNGFQSWFYTVYFEDYQLNKI